MRVLAGIDDTDNLESRGTGFRARDFALRLRESGLADIRGISRHQLYVHPDIPYTSHNSALCIDMDWKGGALADLICRCRDYLAETSAPGSDAGFCIAPFNDIKDDVISFGRNAKDTVLTKQQARDLAKRAGFHLEGVTGDHGGIIGSLACTGLRKSGHDGRFVWVEGVRDLEGVTTASHLLNMTGIDILQPMPAANVAVKASDRIEVSPWPRPVLLEHKAVLLIRKVEDTNAGYEWEIVPRAGTKHY